MRFDKLECVVLAHDIPEHDLRGRRPRRSVEAYTQRVT